MSELSVNHDEYQTPHGRGYQLILTLPKIQGSLTDPSKSSTLRDITIANLFENSTRTVVF